MSDRDPYDTFPETRDRLLAEGSLACLWDDWCMRPATHIATHPAHGRVVACDTCHPHTCDFCGRPATRTAEHPTFGPVVQGCDRHPWPVKRHPWWQWWRR